MGCCSFAFVAFVVCWNPIFMFILFFAWHPVAKALQGTGIMLQCILWCRHPVVTAIHHGDDGGRRHPLQWHHAMTTSCGNGSMLPWLPIVMASLYDGFLMPLLLQWLYVVMASCCDGAIRMVPQDAITPGLDQVGDGVLCSDDLMRSVYDAMLLCWHHTQIASGRPQALLRAICFCPGLQTAFLIRVTHQGGKSCVH
jgi:hypothetical protein